MWVADPDMAHDTHDDLGRWHNLLVWLRESHGMNTGREELLVECRNSPGGWSRLT